MSDTVIPWIGLQAYTIWLGVHKSTVLGGKTAASGDTICQEWLSHPGLGGV